MARRPRSSPARSPARAAAAALPLLLCWPVAAAAVNGITDTEVTFGMCSAFSGGARELGVGMKTGFELAFAAANEAGGVHGRQLKLVALDDGYEPERNKVCMKELVENKKVFAITGNVGTPTAVVAVPYALDKKVLFYGAFTGAGLLRQDPPDRYVINYRASYAEETAATVKYLVEVKRLKPSQIAVFAQEDAYGDAGYNGVAHQVRRYGFDSSRILRVGYKRNTIDVADAAATILKNQSRAQAIIMVPTYKAAAKFVERVVNGGFKPTFASVSFVGATAFADELRALGARYAEGVIVTQVVPLPTSHATAIIRYRDLLKRYSTGEEPNFVSLEGYIAGTILVEALRRTGKALDTERLIDTFETIRGLDLGIGTLISYGPSEHQGSHKVWGTVMDANAVYKTLEME
jgi:ABC-type branched-subunit amino acid transport system substrate-binding protein